MIEAHGLTRRYGAKTAVDDVTFTVQPGKVTGFLGPNGAGKSTTMRLIVGLDHPTRGTVTVNGWRYDQHRAPMQEVGTLLDAKAVHTGRSAYNHLLAALTTAARTLHRPARKAQPDEHQRHDPPDRDALAGQPCHRRHSAQLPTHRQAVSY